MDKVKELKIDSTLWATPSKLVNLLDFKPGKTSIKTESNTQNDIKYCVDRYVYHIDYAKNINNVNPLYLIIPEFYGYIAEHKGRKYLNITLTGINNDVLSEYERMWDGILEQVRKINDCAYIFEKDYYKIKVGSVKCEDLRLDKLIKFNAVAISNRLLIEKDSRFILESYLEECLYDDEWFKK